MYSDFYEIPLPALRFEKVEETHREVNDTEENDARPRQKYKQKEKKTSRKDDIRRSSTAKKRRINHKQTTRKEHTHFQNNETQTETECQ